uniref:Uncharacterized protein n=1 Tax=Oryza rufipogon TaxID=4529 RepID=A0A0E0PJB4_ORYRU
MISWPRTFFAVVAFDPAGHASVHAHRGVRPSSQYSSIATADRSSIPVQIVSRQPGKPAETHRYTTNNDGGAQKQDVTAKLNTKATKQLPHRRRGVIDAELATQATQQRRLHNCSDTEDTKVAKAKSSSDI